MHAKVEFGMYFGYETLKVKLSLIYSLIYSTEAFLETKLLVSNVIQYLIRREQMFS